MILTQVSCALFLLVFIMTPERSSWMDKFFWKAISSSVCKPSFEVYSCPWLPSWSPFRRPAGIEDESLLFVWAEGALEFTDASDTLMPFTLYEYRVRAHNSRGSVESLWSSARTLEAPPQYLPAPWAQATSAHSVLLNWTKPDSPNGIISQYHVVYQERPDDPTLNVSTVHAFTVTVRT